MWKVFCAMLCSSLCNYSVDFVVLTKALFYSYAYILYNRALYTCINVCTCMHLQRKALRKLCSWPGYGLVLLPGDRKK
jgi:hypothetical protein